MLRPLVLLTCFGFALGCRCEELPAMPVQELREAAEKGDVAAQFLLAQAFLHGCGVQKDPHEALVWVLKAGQQGNVQAKTFAVVLRMAWGGSKQEYDIVRPWFRQLPELAERPVMPPSTPKSSLDPELATRAQGAIAAHIVASAEKGDASAQFARGAQYKYGDPVKQDDKEALKWFLRSADSGFSPAQFTLGGMYEKGHGVEKNETEAIRWYEASARQGHILAAYSLGQYCYDKGQGDDARKWLTQAAEAGQENAQGLLGILLLSGQGVEKDFKEAFRWLHVAAENGLPTAQYLTGNMLINGTGTPVSEREGVQWLQKAAAQGENDAIGELGFCYYRGIGIRHEPVTALRLLVKASEGGNERARQFLEWLLDDHFMPMDEEAREAFKTFLEKSNKGDAEDSWVMFYWLSCGKKDTETPEGKAGLEKYLRLAAQAGSEKAKAEMAKRGLK